MPMWLYLGSLVVAMLVAAGLLTSCSVRLAARVVRCAVDWRRAVIAGIASLSISVAVATAALVEWLPWIASAAIGGVALLVVVGAMLKRGGNSWWRAAAALGVFFAVQVVLQMSAALLIRRTLCTAYHMPTAGMAPTLEPGDRFLSDPSLMPRRWDIAVFAAPMDQRSLFAQRVVGLPGESVEIRAGVVHINGVPAAVPGDLAWLKYSDKPSPLGPCRGGQGSPFTLRANEYFVLGDNTLASNDSRYWTDTARSDVQVGAVPADLIRGTVRVVYSPRSRMKILR